MSNNERLINPNNVESIVNPAAKLYQLAHEKGVTDLTIRDAIVLVLELRKNKAETKFILGKLVIKMLADRKYPRKEFTYLDEDEIAYVKKKFLEVEDDISTLAEIKNDERGEEVLDELEAIVAERLEASQVIDQQG